MKSVATDLKSAILHVSCLALRLPVQKKRRSRRKHKKSGVMTPAPTGAPSFIDSAALDAAMDAGASHGGAPGSVAGNSHGGVVEREPSLQSGISHAVRKLRRLKKAFSRPPDGQDGNGPEDVS